MYRLGDIQYDTRYLIKYVCLYDTCIRNFKARFEVIHFVTSILLPVTIQQLRGSCRKSFYAGSDPSRGTCESNM